MPMGALKKPHASAAGVLIAGLAGLFWLGSLTVEPPPAAVEPPPVIDERSALRLARAELDANVAEQALELLRGDLVELRSELEVANEELALYRQMLSIDSLPEGLSVSEMALWPLQSDSAERRYGYRWVLMQNNKQRESLAVVATLALVGQLDGAPITLSFDDLDENAERSLRVRYFTIARGELTLPADFEPARLDVALRYSWMKQPQYTASYPWAAVQIAAAEQPAAIID
jgi:hypothetical protein